MDVWSLAGGSVCHGYMCILCYVKLIGCNGIPYIYGQLEWGVHLAEVYVTLPSSFNFISFMMGQV